MQLTDAIARFHDYLRFEKRYSPHSLDAYASDLSQFRQYLASNFETAEVSLVKTTFIRTWLAQMKDEGLSAKTINRKLSAVKSFFRFLLRLQLIEANPASTLSGPKTAKRLPVFASAADVEKLWNELHFEDNWLGATERLVLQILYHTGIRRSELIQLKPGQVDRHQQVLRILGKGNKERLVPLAPTLIQEIELYQQSKQTQFDFPIDDQLLLSAKGRKLDPKAVYTMVNKHLGLSTTLSVRSPHVMRHTFATHLANAGADLNAIKELLGHSSLAATQIYTHNTIEKLKEVYKQAHPKA